MEITENTSMNMPVLALRGLAIFPGCVLSFDVEREISIRALERAMERDQYIFLVAQRETGTDQPEEKDLYAVGTMSVIRQILRIGDASVRVIMEGKARARLRRLWQTEPYLQGNVEPLREGKSRISESQLEAILRQTYGNFTEYAGLMPRMGEDIAAVIMDDRDPGHLADFIAQNIMLRHQDKQAVLEELRPLPRLRKVNELLAREVEVLSFEHELEGQIRREMGEAQKDHIIREQIRLLQQELGEDEDNELAEYRLKIEHLHLPEEIRDKMFKELDRLAKQPYSSAEASVIRNYLDVCLEMPWGKETRERVSVSAARKLLDRDHFGLEKVKERILEFIAVRQMNPGAKGQMICLVGPPGVGKTSIAISVAAALNRKLARLSLGGVRDEADIRGHRRTYIGSMPGRVIDAIIRGGSMNPLLLLDEIDKLGSDYRGDPASALLEVLDSEQNHAFRDHYMEIPVDLSRVMFVTTANTTDTIPQPLLDRMEVIRLTSYTDEEKVEIARRHLLPKQLSEHGLKKSTLKVSDDVFRAIIRDYTRESGVRLLERRIAALCRKTDMKLVSGEVKRVQVTEEDLPKFLDCQPYPPALHTEREEVGVVNGLAWTETGGEILEVEAVVCEGTGKLELTGNLGDVMKESAQAALSCIRSRAEVLGVEAEFYKNKDIHVHFPEGAVPKDGPSAGIAVTTAMLSALTDRKIQAGLAMTGEVTIRGRVLAIGGLKEKTMAALRSGIGTVLIPKDNVRDLEEIDQTVRAALKFIPVETIDQVFAAALVPQPEAVREETAEPLFTPMTREKTEAVLRQ